MPKMKTRKDKAYKLFSEGKDASSPEIKALGLRATTRYSYYSRWKTEGEPLVAPGASLLPEKKAKKELKKKEKPAQSDQAEKDYFPFIYSIT